MTQPYTVKEVAKLCRVSEWTVRKWCRDGIFYGADKVGKSWLIPRGSVPLSSN